jgi:hypothetical protein
MPRVPWLSYKHPTRRTEYEVYVVQVYLLRIHTEYIS